MDTPFRAFELSSDRPLRYNSYGIYNGNKDLYISLSIHTYEQDSYKLGNKSGTSHEIQLDSLPDKIMYILLYHA